MLLGELYLALFLEHISIPWRLWRVQNPFFKLIAKARSDVLADGSEILRAAEPENGGDTMWDRHMLELTDEHVRTLRALRVDENRPGTILHDFGALLAFVRGRDLPVSKAHQLLPLKVLPQTNALLRHPIEVRLQRPQLKSYPHVQGLYLLLRATGLGQIGGTPAKPLLLIDRSVHEAWSALNPTERYFTLLEAWLLRGRPEIVGERKGAFGFPMRQFADAAALLHRAGAEGLPIADNDEAAWFWYDAPGRMGIALLEMFGLATVVSRPPQDGEGWVVDCVYRTPLGGAVFALLHEAVFSDYEKVAELADTPQRSLGALQPVFAPYVPQWQHSLALPSWVFRGGRHIFKVSLGRGLWRRIAIDAGEPLDVLAGAILDAYAFDHDHLYEFSYRNRFGVDESVHHPYMDEGPWTSEVRVGDVPLAVGQSMTYLFDFGDQWEFGVTLEQIEPAGEGPDRPAVLDGRGDAPEQYPSRDEGEW